MRNRLPDVDENNKLTLDLVKLKNRHEAVTSGNVELVEKKEVKQKSTTAKKVKEISNTGGGGSITEAKQHLLEAAIHAKNLLECLLAAQRNLND
jgi:hypothetical protein